MRYKSHNEIIQRFCATVIQKRLCPRRVNPRDRGFARGRYVIKAQQIPFVMRVCRNVRNFGGMSKQSNS